MPAGIQLGQGRPGRGYPLSYNRLRRVLNADETLRDWLSWQAIKDVVTFQEDFVGKAIDTTFTWALANGAGSAAVAFAVNVQQGGVIRGTTGTSNDNTASQSIASPKQWSGAKYAMCEWRFAPITTIEGVLIEVGFTDVVPSNTLPVVNVLATPTINASVADAVILLYDKTTTTTTNEVATIAENAPGLTPAKYTYTAPNAAVAATFRTARIQLQGDGFSAWLDGVPVATAQNTTNAAVTGATTLCLWGYIAAHNATSKSEDIDYVIARQAR